MVGTNLKENPHTYWGGISVGSLLIVVSTITSLALSLVFSSTGESLIGFQLFVGMGTGMIAFSGVSIIVTRLGYMPLNKKQVREAKNMGRKVIIVSILLILFCILVRAYLLVSFVVWSLFGGWILYQDDLEDNRRFPGYDFP